MTAPLTPADCDLRDFAFQPIDVRRLLTSETWIMGTGDERSAAITLWLECWHQVPAASVPNNDRMLAHLSQAGVKWGKVKQHALRGWVDGGDGRLYHPVVAEKALAAWIEKLLTSISGAAGNAKRWAIEVDTRDQEAKLLDAIQRLRAIAPRSPVLKKKQVVSIATPSKSDRPPIKKSSPPDSSGDRKREGEGERDIYSVAEATDGGAVSQPAAAFPPLPDMAATPSAVADMTKAELWSAGKSLLEQAGLPKAQCGSFVGKLVKDYGEAVVVDAVRSAVAAQPADPVEYLKACCQRSAGQRQPVNKQIALEQRNRAVADEWLAQQGAAA
ncbi:MAG: hypothetical protein RL268_91 [Pseudomonadota bacterium]|jgi:hypothetical protein